MNKRAKIIVAVTVIMALLFALSLVLLINRGQGSQNATPGNTGSSHGTGEFPGTTGSAQTNETGGVDMDATSFGGGFEFVDTDETKDNSATKPSDTTSATQPSATQPAEPESSVDKMTYAEYMALSGDEQQALYDKYFAEDPVAFATWFQKIKKEYEDENPSIIVTGPVDLEDYLNPSNP